MSRPHAVCEVELLTKGPVRGADRSLAVDKVRAMCEVGHEPVLAAVVKLQMRDDTTTTKSAIAEATLDLNGVPIRAHASADTMTEAIDELDDRLTRRLRRHRKRLEDRRHDPEPDIRRPHPGYATVDADHNGQYPYFYPAYRGVVETDNFGGGGPGHEGGPAGQGEEGVAAAAARGRAAPGERAL